MRNVLLSTSAVVLFLSFTSASAQFTIATPILTSDENFRDLAGISVSNGGSGFVNPTNNNGVMRTEVFYRSEALSRLSNADWATLSSLHIGLDIDLRTPSEIQGPPSLPLSPNAGIDWVPNGAAYTNVNIYGTTEPPSTASVDSPAAAVTYMTATYQGFVADPNQRAALHTVLIDLANEPNAALFHCSGGKDRTGWTAMLLQSIAGVSPTTIMNDYLATNSYMAGSINQILAAVPIYERPTLAVMLGVQPSFLQAGFDQVIASYGSMYAYLTQGLGLTQADIYVLRAKMVYYQSLPGQSGFTGNAAAGAVFLNALQNSPLSGHYTAYNYYLQSALDAGTLGSVPAQVGGQVHADTTSFLLRQPQWIEEAVTPYTYGGDLREGKTRIWMTGLGGGFSSDSRSGVASSTEHNAGTLIGATYRMNRHASANLGIGYNWGSVASADATATVNTVLAMMGGRYGFSALETGLFVDARAVAGWVGYESERALGADLGTATGNTNGAVYSGKVGLGEVIPLAPFTVTLQTGVRLAGVVLGSFKESGSDLALNIHDINKTFTSLTVDLNVSLDRQQLESWTIAPAVTIGYERVLSNPQAESLGTLYGFAVTQNSAYSSYNLLKTGLGVAAQRDAFNMKAEFNTLVGDGGKSTGIGGQLSIGYSF